MVARIGVLLFLVSSLGLVGCGGDKKKEKEGPVACESNQDCPKGLVCLASECADPRVNKGPSNMVTPEKVKREVDDIQRKAQERADKALEGL